MTDNNKASTEQKIAAWSKEAYQKATSFLAQKGIITETVSIENSSYLAPVVAIWKIKSTEGKWFWVITGDLPSDMLANEAAATARDAIRAFSFKWQMDCENIRKQQGQDQTQLEFANMLQGRAEALYELFEQENMWQ
jgi:hypothetical protein